MHEMSLFTAAIRDRMWECTEERAKNSNSFPFVLTHTMRREGTAFHCETILTLESCAGKASLKQDKIKPKLNWNTCNSVIAFNISYNSKVQLI